MTPKSKKILILLSALFLAVGFLSFAQMVHAQPDLGITQVGPAIGLPSTDIRLVVAKIIRTALGLLGIVALVLMLYAGFVWMTAGGNDEKVSQSKKILFNAAIGLAIILTSYAITSFIINGLVGATTGNGGAGGSGGGGGDNPYFPAGIFYVDSLPSGGQMCIRNVHLAVTFNKEVDVATLNGNVVVQKADGTEQAGEWQVLSNTTATFVPNGDCGGGVADCFAASTAYALHFKNGSAVKTSDGLMTLNCAIKAGCADVQFTTGDGVDRLPPQVKIESIPGDALRVGSVVPVVVSYTDDNGVQKIDLSADNYFVGSQTVASCQKTGSVTVNWPTVGIAGGQHTLRSTGYDWSAQNYTTSTNVNLLPQHCFDNVLDPGEITVGPPASGGECGVGAGGPCAGNAQCASGYCDPTAGVCVDKMRINGVSPLSGGPGTYVSIAGNYFGNTAGKVFIGDTQAPLAPCSVGAWKPYQIIAEVPADAISGPVSVETAPNASGNKFTDATNDNFGPTISDFTVNSIVRPGLCNIIPSSALHGEEISLVGDRFGIAVDKVFFDQQNVPVTPINWTNTLIKTRVPLFSAGPVGVKVSRNNLDSNSVKFFVEQGLSGTAPVISNITPDHGAKGEYITITGNNFGNQTGLVRFKMNDSGLPTGDFIDGEFNFPAGCVNTWTDKQIIVKFPSGVSVAAGRSYFVQVRPADISLGLSPIGPVFKSEIGEPTPGVCNINPVSGPSPFPAGSPDMNIIGENFGPSPKVYFWSAGASATNTTGRVLAITNSVINLAVGQSISTRPPVGTQTGPVVVSRVSDNKISNPQNFSVVDCVKNNNTCPEAGTHCCSVGTESGMCKPAGELCEGQTLSAGYIWRFSTKDIPKVPRVVERCNGSTDLGLNIPTPSPSAIWDTATTGPHHNVCRSASVVVEFNLDTINNISRANLVVNECQPDTVNEAARTCTVAGQVTVDEKMPSPPPSGTGDFVPQPGSASTVSLELNPVSSYNTGKWKNNTWYQVVLKDGITAGTGTSTAPLAKDKPCGAGTSYCFIFRADSQDCKIKQVVVTPYSYFTSILEAPMKRRTSPADAGVDVNYIGHGLSTQHCIVMDTAAFSWLWGTQNANYANIFGSATEATAKVSAIANTVGVGLADPVNAVNITAKATLASANYTGTSPLTVDLNNPQVVEFWPKCLESCTNAEVGVRFNTTMSNKNLPSGPVKLLKCNDENCFDTESVVVAADVFLDDGSDFRILKIANSNGASVELQPDTIYQVILSVTTTDVSSPELLWSAAVLGDPSTHSKPYNKQFTWRFKTKKEKCKISRVDVVPQNYFAEFINDKELFSAQPYSSPDTCSAQGQKLNPWTVSWNWDSSSPLVADVKTFSTVGNNPYCTLGCVRKGSTIPASFTVGVPVCGNNKIEAGEDCDTPNKLSGCSLDCRRLGNTNTTTCGNGIIEPDLGETCDPGLITSAVGCGSNCLHTGSSRSTGATATGASICGNGSVGSGEDCDTGISSSSTISNSALRCSETCLHKGTKLSAKWCSDNDAAPYGGFVQADFNSACRNAISRCGDGEVSLDEDVGCDLGGGLKADWCNDFCLINTSTHSECVAGADGCDVNRQNLGSSLLYTPPSLCGDGVAGIGEDAFCETLLPDSHSGNNPWALVTGVGLGVATGVPPAQKTDISANTTSSTVGGAVGDKGQFTIACGYKTDAECQAHMGSDWGVATNGCCYVRPKLLSVYPGNTSTNQSNVCPNTSIEATFDQEISLSSLNNNLVVARGIGATSSCTGTEEVTDLVSAVSGSDYNNLPWYKKIIVAVVDFFKNLIGQNAAAVRTEIQSAKWCAGEDLGQADIITTSSTLSKITFKLSKPLAFDTDYFVALKDGLRSKQGISIGKKSNGKPFSWKFITGSKMCEIDHVAVEPTQVYLNKVGATSTLIAHAYNVNNAQVQPIPGYYDWKYLWQPAGNPYVNLEISTSSKNTISAQNRNGEIDVRASAVITDNIYSGQFGAVATGKSHAIVFLCENPWPPKDLFLGGLGPYIIFPYEDKVGNNDGFNLAAGAFDNTSIPPSPSGGYFNFRSYYCADAGGFGTADDLPYLRPAVQVSGAIVGDTPTTSLKRFIFTSATNNDAIGMAVFSNPMHLTVSQWFATDRALGGQGFLGAMQTTKIDGYDALTDGNNIYVDALNINFSTAVPPVAGNLYSNIYLFSINANAQASTKKVFEQIIGNLRFNTNLTNYGYCGADMANPGASTTCQTDLDCSSAEVCSVQIDKLKRNYRRLRDLNIIQNLLGY